MWSMSSPTAVIALPVFCDLLTHVTLSLEAGMGMECARRYKTNWRTAAPRRAR